MTDERDPVHHVLTWDEPPHHLDSPTILAAGRRRHRHRRVAAIVAAVATIVAGSVVAAGGPNLTQPATTAYAQSSPSPPVATAAGSLVSPLQDRAEQAHAMCDADGESAVINGDWSQDTADRELVKTYATTSESLSIWRSSEEKDNDGMTPPRVGANLVAICYFSGDFSVPFSQPPPVAGQLEQPVPQTLLGITFSQDGEADLLMVGDARTVDLDLHHPIVG